MTREEFKHSADILINTSFVMIDAVDIMVRLAERINAEYEIGLRRDFKSSHKELMTHLMHARVTLDKFNTLCDKVLSTHNRDLMRLESNDLCRLILYYADRTCEDAGHKSRLIEDYVKHMPPTGNLKDSFIEDNFHLR